MTEAERLSSLRDYVQGQYRDIEFGSTTHGQALINITVFAAEQNTALDSNWFGPSSIQQGLSDLGRVVIGDDIRRPGTGDFFAGFAPRGASGFDESMQDQSAQIVHAVAGLVVSLEYGTAGEIGALLREAYSNILRGEFEGADYNLFFATFLARDLLEAGFTVEEAFEIFLKTQEERCFLAGTMIDMWPTDPDIKPDPNGLYNKKEVRAKIWKKPIEQITPNDWVVSFDKQNNLKPGRVTRTFENENKIILDFHGTFVTPGHVYYRKDSKKSYPFEPLIDILRDDGIVMHADGRQIRAATNCEVGSEGDKELWVFLLYEDENGHERVRDKKKIRLGTRWMIRNGDHFSMLDYMKMNDIELLEQGDLKGYVRFNKVGTIVPFAWTFSDALPNPEDFVLQRSGTTLEEIYEAGEWEAQTPQMPAPMVMEGGPVQPLPNAELKTMARNTPMAFRENDPGRPTTHFSGNANERKHSRKRGDKIH